MAALAYTINSKDLSSAGSKTTIVTAFVFVVSKKLRISPSDALVNPFVVNPERAYSANG